LFSRSVASRSIISPMRCSKVSAVASGFCNVYHLEGLGTAPESKSIAG
jgi:hypothetical protein